jgi:hypothetical protein
MVALIQLAIVAGWFYCAWWATGVRFPERKGVVRFLIVAAAAFLPFVWLFVILPAIWDRLRARRQRRQAGST